jgi:hypothetical protein
MRLPAVHHTDSENHMNNEFHKVKKRHGELERLAAVDELVSPS